MSDVPITLDASNWDDDARRLRTSTVVTDEWTLITAAGDMLSELYNNVGDPLQTYNVIKQNPAAARELHAKYISFLESHGADEAFNAPRRTLV